MIRSHPRGDEDAHQWLQKPGTGALGALHPYPFARRVDIGAGRAWRGRHGNNARGGVQARHGSQLKPASADLFGDVARNFQVFDPLDFIAELTQHISDHHRHLVFGRYTSKGAATTRFPHG